MALLSIADRIGERIRQLLPDEITDRLPSDGSGGSATRPEGVGPVNGVRQVARGIMSSVAEHTPFSDGTQVRLRQADSAAEQARQAEQEAMEAAERASELAEEADAVETHGERERKAVRDRTSREVQSAVKQAEAEARAHVNARKQEAEAKASADVEAVDQETRSQSAAAKARASEAAEEAQEKIDTARALLAEARERADEAAEAAADAAREAAAHAEELAAEAQERATLAQGRAGAAQGPRRTVEAEGRALAGDIDAAAAVDLNDQTKAELIDLAKSMGLEPTPAMRKQQIVALIRKHAKT